jgi:hypothetical protein
MVHPQWCQEQLGGPRTAILAAIFAFNASILVAQGAGLWEGMVTSNSGKMKNGKVSGLDSDSGVGVTFCWREHQCVSAPRTESVLFWANPTHPTNHLCVRVRTRVLWNFKY